jgi:geranylgeranyl reductase family protein
MYDVAVVGAGPAGATVSRLLALQGFRVCLIDKEKFPRDKPCGGAFSENILEDFPFLNRRSSEFLRGVAKVGILHSPNRRVSLRGRARMAVARRLEFDSVLYESAIEAGADSISGVRAKELTQLQSKVQLQLSGGNQIEARFVIGADGVNSTVARTTHLNRRWPTRNITACRVVEIPASDSQIVDRYTHNLEYHFYANLGGHPGYGWIFPKQGFINVGLGFVGNSARGLPRLFRAFLRLLKRDGLLPGNADASHAKGALVPTGGPLSRTVRGRCLLVGDAAGMVSPLTGGGIGYAMRAARHAAKTITSSLEDDFSPDTLATYHEAWYNDFGKEFSSHLLAQKIFTSSFTDLLFEIGRRDLKIQQMVSGAMSESGDNEIDIRKLLLRTLGVCFRGGFGFP